MTPYSDLPVLLHTHPVPCLNILPPLRACRPSSGSADATADPQCTRVARQLSHVHTCPAGSRASPESNTRPGNILACCACIINSTIPNRGSGQRDRPSRGYIARQQHCCHNLPARRRTTSSSTVRVIRVPGCNQHPTILHRFQCRRARHARSTLHRRCSVPRCHLPGAPLRQGRHRELLQEI